VWVDISGGPYFALPGEQFNLQLNYGNRGSVLAASAAITVTLPAGLSFVDATVPPAIIGDQLVWQVGELPGKSGPNTITLTVEVDVDALLGQAVYSVAEIQTSASELEQLNNTSQAKTYLGHVVILPIIRR
jgi:hypothetical protein